jgi:hypothetical protein
MKCWGQTLGVRSGGRVARGCAYENRSVSVRVLSPLSVNPTAMQTRRRARELACRLWIGVHDMPARPLPMDRRELGVGSIDQVKPFHCSINVVWLLVWVPTAVQEFSDVHDTPRRDRKEPPEEGVACSDHFPARSSRACPMAVACQRSASSSVSRLASTVESPTAVQAVVDVHDVLQRRSPCEPRAGIRCRVQAVPFQRGAKGTCPIA